MRMILLLLLWPAPPARAAEPMPSIEAYMTQAQASIAEIERVLLAARGDSRREEKACRESFSVDFLMEGLRTLKVPAAAFVALPELREGLTELLTCRAFAADDYAPCLALEPLSALPTGVASSMPPHYICRRDYHLWSFDLARLAGRPELYRRCLEECAYHRPGDEGPFKDGSHERACAVVRDFRASGMSVEQACSQLKPFFDPPLASDECARRVRSFYGVEDTAHCASLQPEANRDRCLYLAALRKAVADGSAKACGDWAPCRLLMSRPLDCAAPMESARAAYCGRFEMGYAWRLHADLSLLMERAALLLGELSASGMNREPLFGRLIKLEARRQELARELGGSVAPSKLAPALPGMAFIEVDLALGRAFAAALARDLSAPSEPCLKDFSVPGLLASLREGKRLPDPELLSPLHEYFGCQALVLGAPGVCSALEMTILKDTAFLQPDYLCRHDFLMWNHDLARLSGQPDRTQHCITENYYRWSDPFDGGPFKPGAFRDGCERIAGYTTRDEDQRRVCVETMPYYRYSKEIGECVDRLRYAHGEDARLCETLRNPRVRRDRCLDLVALRRALRQSSGCGDSFYCRMQLDRRPESCAPYLERLRRMACLTAKNGADAAPQDTALPADLLDRAQERLETLQGVSEDELIRRRTLIEWIRRRLSAR